MPAAVSDTERRQPAAQRRLAYLRCRTCGRYITADERVQLRYCSEECAERFRRCTTCGRYYPAKDAESEMHCSRECATRYAIRLSRGSVDADRDKENAT